MRFYWKRALVAAGLSVLAAAPQYAADTRHLTLIEAVHMALAQNRALKIARLKVLENEQKKAGEHAAYFPAKWNPACRKMLPQKIRIFYFCRAHLAGQTLVNLNPWRAPRKSRPRS